MTRYVLDMETLWEGKWLPLGTPLTVEADSPAEALALTTWRGLQPGVMYRIRIISESDGAELLTPPAQFPAQPVLVQAERELCFVCDVQPATRLVTCTDMDGDEVLRLHCCEECEPRHIPTGSVVVLNSVPL